MEYLHNFDEICSKVPFPALLDHLQTPYKIEGQIIKTDEAIITPKKALKNGLCFDLFVWRNKTGKPKGGGSILDYVQYILDLKSKIKACEWLKANILGENAQKDNIPELTLEFHEFLGNLGIGDKIAEHYAVGYVKRGIMAGRIAFKLIDHENRHRGYIGYDHRGTMKTQWFLPKGTRTSDMLYNYYRKSSPDTVILVSNPLEALYMYGQGWTQTISLLSKTLSEEQRKLMSFFKHVHVIGENLQGIALELSQICFVRAYKRNVLEMTGDEITRMLTP